MTDPTSPDITGALALLREAMRASPVPPAEILIFAGEACAAAGYPPTTPELDDKLRALGLLFGKAAPGSADLTHFLWHILEGNVPRALAVQALQLVQENSDFKGLSGVMTRNVLEAAREDIAAVYGGDMIKNLGLLLKSIARRAVEMTTAGMAGEVSAARSERTAAMQTIKALEADLTKIAKAYYGEEAPTGISADGIAEFIRGAHEAARALPATESALKAALETEDLRRQLNKAQAEASHQRDRAAKANGDIEVITAAYFKAGFGPSPTTPEKVAAAIGDLLAARERAKQKASDAEAHAARWLKACKLLGWDTEADPAISSDGIGKMTAFMERMQALLVKPLRDELRSRQAPNLAAFGFEKATPERIVEIAAERSQADAREIGRLRAANRDLSAKIESAPGSAISSDGIGKMTALDVQRALLDKARQLVNDAHTCEQHRRQVDHIDETLGRMLGKEHAANLSIDGRLNELAGQRDAYKKAAEPHPHAHAHMLEHLDLRAQAADMARVRDLLHDRRTKLALRDGEALSYAELVQGLLSDFHLAEHDLALVRGKGPSAADVLHGAWAGDADKIEVTSDFVWDGKAWVPKTAAAGEVSAPDWKVWEAFIADIVKLTGARFDPGHVGVMLDAITRWHAVAHAK